MRIQAYLRILSDENTIRAFEKEASVSNASIKRLKASSGLLGNDWWWNWQTAKISIDTDNPDEGLRTLLHAHRPIFPIIKKYQRLEADVYLEVVTQYEKGEEPRGLYLSSETIELLAEMGGALDNDVVPVVGESHAGDLLPEF